MATKTKPNAGSRPAYKKKLNECRELRHQGRTSAYRRAKLLCEVYEDRDFQEDIGTTDSFALASALDEYCEDTALRFLQLKAVLELFPDEQQWQQNGLRSLYEQAKEETRKRKQAEVPNRPPARPVTPEQYRAPDYGSVNPKSRIRTEPGPGGEPDAESEQAAEHPDPPTPQNGDSEQSVRNGRDEWERPRRTGPAPDSELEALRKENGRLREKVHGLGQYAEKMRRGVHNRQQRIRELEQELQRKDAKISELESLLSGQTAAV